MEASDLQKAKAFLASHDYIVKVCKTVDGCEVKFPHPKMIKPFSQEEKVNYKLRIGEEPGVYVNDEFWSAPEYALRLMITCDIINRMRKIPVHESLISYYNDDKEVEGIYELLAFSISNENRKKEGFLATLLSKAIEDKFPSLYEDVANTPEHNVGTGYRLLKSFF